MNNKFFNNFVTSILISSFVVFPFLSATRTAEAQSLGAYTSGLIPTIVQLPLCVGKLNSATSRLFGGSSRASTLAKIENTPIPGVQVTPSAPPVLSWPKIESPPLAGLNPNLSDTAFNASTQFSAVETDSPAANKKLDELLKQSAAIKASTASLDANDTCIKNIGRLVIKMLLQKLTLSTVNWINSGFDGQPAFIKDTGKFFEDIAKNEILQFGLEINNPELFPFGKVWLQNQAIAFNQKFADNARYSLDELIRDTSPQYSALSFQTDFSQGGWGAWSAMTQVPANNPLGFQLIASEELQKRLEGTTQSTAEKVQKALDQASGFLGDLRCVFPNGQPTSITQQQKRDALAAGQQDPCIGVGSWQYVTPGSLIAAAATSTIKYPENNLLKADDLNDAVAAILDALLSRFSSDLMTKGYANLGDEGADGRFVFNPEAERTDFNSQTEKDFTPTQLTSSWLFANPNFNIRTDLSQALIDEQRTYSDKLKLQNKELLSTTDGREYAMGANGISNAYGLVPAINQLDYCIPGPHPGFEDDSRRVLDSVTNLIRPLTIEDVRNGTMGSVINSAQALAPLAGAAIGASIGTAAFPVVGTVVGAAIGAMASVAIGYFNPDDGKKLREFFAAHIQVISGVKTDIPDNESASVGGLTTKQGAVQALNVMLERYIDLAHKVYNKNVLPNVYKDAAGEYNRRDGYGGILLGNEDKISSTKNTVNMLGEMKIAVEQLNQKRRAGGFSANSEENDLMYESALKAQINAFGRLSADMVNGDDIASADDLLSQIIDEKKYVYDDLLKGPFGCEKELELGQKLPDQLYNTKRMEYPFPIIYNYDMAAGAPIPDPAPWSDGRAPIINRTSVKANTSASALGPGFLSFYSFQGNGDDTANYCKTAVADANGAVATCQIQIIDLLPLGNCDPGPSCDDWHRRSVGTTPSAATSSPFETVISVY